MRQARISLVYLSQHSTLMATSDLMPTIDTFVTRLQDEGYPVQVVLEALKEYTEIYEELSSK